MFQWFESDGSSTIDISAFDKVVKAAEKNGIKLLVAFTNNWADYGGMDVYTVNLGGKHHDDVNPSNSDHHVKVCNATTKNNANRTSLSL